MKSKQLHFGQGFKVLLGNRRVQATQMVIPPGKSEGRAGNRHRGADQRHQIAPPWHSRFQRVHDRIGVSAESRVAQFERVAERLDRQRRHIGLGIPIDFRVADADDGDAVGQLLAVHTSLGRPQPRVSSSEPPVPNTAMASPGWTFSTL